MVILNFFSELDKVLYVLQGMLCWPWQHAIDRHVSTWGKIHSRRQRPLVLYSDP